MRNVLIVAFSRELKKKKKKKDRRNKRKRFKRVVAGGMNFFIKIIIKMS